MMSQTQKRLSFNIVRYLLKYFSLVVSATELFAQTNINLTNIQLEEKYTTTNHTKKVFMQPIDGLNDEEQDKFMLGFSFYRIPWVEAPSATTARDGLGPLFNANTCISCHPNNAVGSVFTHSGSVSRAYVLRLSIPSTPTKGHHRYLHYNGFLAEPSYGSQLNINGVHGVPYEGKPMVTYDTIPVTYPDGKVVILSKPKKMLKYQLKALHYGEMQHNVNISPRLAPALVGLGLLEQLSDQAILAHEDIHDRDGDGISGKANRVYSAEFNDFRIGKYTWKASIPTLKHQVAAAAHNDMGLTNPLFKVENCTEVQKACIEAPRGDKTLHSEGFDLPQKRVDAISFYLQSLKVPHSKITEKRGERLFKKLGCVKCHVSEFQLDNGYTIRPFSDMLLHDMGEGLSDGRTEFQAKATEWRTAPLWGIGKYQLATSKAPEFLHDGRAKTLEEAILWHGGEALQSRNQFLSLPTKQREALLRYLNEL